MNKDHRFDSWTSEDWIEHFEAKSVCTRTLEEKLSDGRTFVVVFENQDLSSPEIGKRIGIFYEMSDWYKTEDGMRAPDTARLIGWRYKSIFQTVDARQAANMITHDDQMCFKVTGTDEEDVIIAWAGEVMSLCLPGFSSSYEPNSRKRMLDAQLWVDSHLDQVRAEMIQWRFPSEVEKMNLMFDETGHVEVACT